MKNQRNIIVAGAVSTGQYFIEDIAKRGYHPIALKNILPNQELMEAYEEVYRSMPDYVELICEKPTYEETLAEVRKYEPILILAGAEDAVALTTRLAEDLHLPGNPSSILPAMTEKPAMHEALKKAGLRYIPGKIISTVEEGLAFFQEHNLNRTVVKPIRSAGSQGLFFCDTREEAAAAIQELLSMTDFYGFPIKEVLIQERIVGTEYIVNTVSCNGRHKLTSVLRYTKLPTQEGGNIYDYLTTIVDLEPGHADMISYAFQVADAIGYRYGEIHGEYILDEKGPVLVEVNCRPMGGSCPPEWLNKVYGQHETDSILDAYLEPDCFLSTINEPYHPHNMAAIKFLMVPRDMDVESLPIYQIARNLRSFHKIAAKNDHSSFFMVKTRDMETNGGQIYLVHDNPKVVEDDIRLLNAIEQTNFQLMVNDGESRLWFKKDDVKSDIEEIIRVCSCHGSILIVTDDSVAIQGAVAASYQQLKASDTGYKNVIIDISTSALAVDESNLLKMLFDIMKRVQPGGRILFTEQAYSYLTGKKKGAEILLQVLGCRIEAPCHGRSNIVIGTRT